MGEWIDKKNVGKMGYSLGGELVLGKQGSHMEKRIRVDLCLRPHQQSNSECIKILNIKKTL